MCVCDLTSKELKLISLSMKTFFFYGYRQNFASSVVVQSSVPACSSCSDPFLSLGRQWSGAARVETQLSESSVPDCLLMFYSFRNSFD